jgi:hypothetical protein
MLRYIGKGGRTSGSFSSTRQTGGTPSLGVDVTPPVYAIPGVYGSKSSTARGVHRRLFSRRHGWHESIQVGAPGASTGATASTVGAGRRP